MKSVGRVLELSLAANSASANSEISAERTSSLKAATGPLERPLALGLDYLARKHKSMAATALSGISRMSVGMTYLGCGAMASVYSNGDEVTKVYRHTATMTPGERQTYLEEHAIAGDILRSHLGNMVVGQSFQVGLHPLGSYEVVLGKQPFVSGKGLDLFITNSTDLHKDDIYDFCERRDDGKSQLNTLVEATFQGSDHSGLVPDLNGADNFRLHGQGETLTLIDAEPISQSHHPWVHDLILRQAEHLDAFLGAA